MNLEILVKLAQIVGFILAGISLVFTAVTYIKNNKLKRGEWLKSLFEKFYEGKTFSKIRKEIEYERIGVYLELNENGDVKSEENEEELVDYLNFFEFIATLVKNGHLRKGEVNQMFGYFLKAINKNDFLKNYLIKYDFENLDELLKEYE
ncbi:MAG: hypothetical protein ACKVOM_07855 [Ferruginibacter sp.]